MYYYYPTYHDSCILLNVHYFSSRAKPWTCQLDLGIYSPIFQYYQALLNYPKMFAYFRYVLENNIIPSPIPKLHMNIFLEFENTINLDILAGWVLSISRDRSERQQFSNDILIFIEGCGKTTSFPGVRMYSIGICSVYETHATIEYTELNSKLIHALISHRKFKAPEKLRNWDIYHDRGNEFVDNVVKQLLKCEGLQSPSHKLIF